MSKKLDSILKKLESEKNQKNIKKFNIVLSILAIFFVARLSSEFNLTSIKITNSLIFALIMQLMIMFISYKIWKNFLINNNIETNALYLDNWSQANINKYIPGGIGLPITRFSISKNLSKDSKNLIFGMIEDQLKGVIIIFPFIIGSFIFVRELQKNYFYFISVALTLYLISKISDWYSKKLNFKSFHLHLGKASCHSEGLFYHIRFQLPLVRTFCEQKSRRNLRPNLVHLLLSEKQLEHHPTKLKLRIRVLF